MMSPDSFFLAFKSKVQNWLDEEFTKKKRRSGSASKMTGKSALVFPLTSFLRLGRLKMANS